MRYGYETTDGATYNLLLERARQKRQHPTDAERILWEFLRNKQLGVRFRRQHPIYDFIPDFVCLSKKLIVEVDGEYHLDQVQTKEDRERTQYLENIGYKVLRFTNHEVLNGTEKVLEEIRKHVAITSPDPSEGGEVL